MRSYGNSIIHQEDQTIRNPIHKVLSTLSTHNVQALLMGGQACVVYGAAEFSRDTDIAILASEANLELLTEALRSLQARRIAVPPFDIAFLLKGHAVHFRCYHPDVLKARIDVMSVMRNVDTFEELWKRRVTFTLPDVGQIKLLSLPDLVRAKKTQRDKDWPMIRRLIESDFIREDHPSKDTVKFWLMESRTPEMLLQLSQQYKQETEELFTIRPLLAYASAGESAILEAELEQEQKHERDLDRKYWSPLLKELEELRRESNDVEEDV